MFGKLDLVAADRLGRDLFVDDLISGGTRKEVQRFVGREDPETLKRDGSFTLIMEPGGLIFKAMITSTELDGDKMKKLGSSVLGVEYSAEKDAFKYTPVVNVSKRRRGKPTGPDLTPENLSSFQVEELVRRTCLSVCNSWLDFMGHCTPITIRLKCAVKKLFAPVYGLSWDDPIPVEEHEKWQKLIHMLVNAKPVTFKRTVTINGETDEYVVVAYFDGSDEAFSCVLYLLAKSPGEDSYRVRLLTSKAKVAPEWEVNTVRMELSGAVLVSRVTLRAVVALHKKPRKVWIVGDSETVLAVREKSSGIFKEWYSNRIGETHDNMRVLEQIAPVGDWHHVPSEFNAADMASRLESTMEDISEGSEWQEGPAYLKKMESEWPFNRNFAERKKQAEIYIPKEEINLKYRNFVSTTVENVSLVQLDDAVLECHRVELEGGVITQDVQQNNYDLVNKDNLILKIMQDGFITNSWETLLRRTANLFKWGVKPEEGVDVSAVMRNKAIHFWMKVAAPDTIKAYEQGKLKALTLYEHEGILVVTGRAEAGMKLHFGTSYLPVLMSNTRTAQLIMLWAHEEQHLGRDITLSTSYMFAWIVGGKRLAVKICSLCIRCRYLARVLEGQKMASLPDRLLVPCPPWTHLGLDLIGPVMIKKKGGSKQTRRNAGEFKAWITLILCLNTKAVKLYLNCGYSTQDFIMSYERHVANHGDPLTVHSDRGSQLVSAAGEIDTPDINWDVVAGTNPKTTWIFCPAGSQHRNGGAERFVRKFKILFKAIYKDAKLDQAEMELALARTGCILNSRPVSARMGSVGGTDPDFLVPITPNTMQLGRANSDVLLRDYSDASLPLDRVKYVAELESAWWNQFKVLNFSSLVPTYKWTEARRSMQSGDVVLVQYASKSKSGEYRLARVIVADMDDDGLVRTVIVRYSLLQNLPEKDRMKYKGTVTYKFLRTAIQRLVLIMPLEEQEGIPPITDEMKQEARKAVGIAHEVEANVVAKKAKVTHKSLITDMIRYRAEFDMHFSLTQLASNITMVEALLSGQDKLISQFETDNV